MPKWSKEQVEQALRDKDWPYTQRDIENGIQYELSDGTPIDWYHTGNVVVRGKKTSLKQEALKIFVGDSPMEAVPIAPSTPLDIKTSPKRVFIVYGHDANAREQLELILRRLRLEPIVLQNLPAAGDTIIEKLEALTATDFACVLLTPDDEGYECGHSEAKRPRARQNVVLELGMVLAKLGRKHVAILIKGNDLEKPSDIGGLIYIPFNSHVEETKNLLAADLQEAGFNIQVKDLLP